jgi:hypothetical protein
LLKYWTGISWTINISSILSGTAPARRWGPCFSSEEPTLAPVHNPGHLVHLLQPVHVAARAKQVLLKLLHFERHQAHDSRPPLPWQYGVGTIVKLLKFGKDFENKAFLGDWYFNPLKIYEHQQQTDIADACAITPGMVLIMHYLIIFRVSSPVGKKSVYYWLSCSWFAGILGSSVANSSFW